MNSAIEALCDRYADWLLERQEAGERPTAYLFDPGTGGNPNANHRLLKRLEGQPIPVVMIDRHEWVEPARASREAP